ncbi:hypothetical protein [Pseudaminobacter sp. NGMCC 1.201702]|uniref:hypothetical protein n=1 Tax=Pseudaminobacter sp. NGMCC 1.201702 TaxID=3391825 RepID=UPI0039EF4FAD
MDQRLVTALQTLGELGRQDALAALASAFSTAGAERHTVRAARDRFNTIVAHARNGTPQLIGARPKSVTVVMSLSDFVDMVQAAAQRQSFGAALEAAGFQPAPGKKMAARQGFPQEPLARRRSFKKPDCD